MQVRQTLRGCRLFSSYLRAPIAAMTKVTPLLNRRANLDQWAQARTITRLYSFDTERSYEREFAGEEALKVKAFSAD